MIVRTVDHKCRECELFQRMCYFDINDVNPDTGIRSDCPLAIGTEYFPLSQGTLAKNCGEVDGEEDDDRDN